LAKNLDIYQKYTNFVNANLKFANGIGAMPKNTDREKTKLKGEKYSYVYHAKGMESVLTPLKSKYQLSIYIFHKKIYKTSRIMTKYNLTEKKPKQAAYRSLVRSELVDELYEKIQQVFILKKKYKDPDYSAKKLAEELNTNTRYISAVVNIRFNMNYSTLVNKYRIDEAMYLLTDKRFLNKNMEEISAMVGFANRQSFYAAFYKFKGMTPRAYRINQTKNS
jgi:AraC-like DNA-binding protein